MNDSRLCRCGHRLSVVDIAGLCLSCQMDTDRVASESRYLVIDANGQKRCKCGGVVARWSTNECAACAAERVRNNRAAAKGGMSDGGRGVTPGKMGWKLR